MVDGSNLNARFTGERREEWRYKILWCDWTDTQLDKNGKTNLVFKGKRTKNAKGNEYNKKSFPISPNDLVLILSLKLADESPEDIYNGHSFDYDCSLSTIKDIFCLHNMGKIDTWFNAQAEQPQYWSETYNENFGHDLDYNLFKDLTHKHEMELFKAAKHHSRKKFDDQRMKIIDSKVTPGVSIYDKFHEDIIVDLCTGNKQLTQYAVIAVWKILHGDKELIDYCHEDYVECFGE